jgi:hypothetical protein
MARPRLHTDRPRCPQGHAGEVLLAGRRVWKGGAFSRQRFLCVPRQGRRHKFSLPHRQPTPRHPHGDTCPACDARPGRTGGPLTAVDHRFSAAELAGLLIRLGQGSSLRAASEMTRLDARRPSVDGLASRQADLAADYLDAFGAAIDAAVTPQAWPPILILDSLPLGVRAYDAGDERSELRAGALLMAAGMASRASGPAVGASAWLPTRPPPRGSTSSVSSTSVTRSGSSAMGPRPSPTRPESAGRAPSSTPASTTCAATWKRSLTPTGWRSIPSWRWPSVAPSGRAPTGRRWPSWRRRARLATCWPGSVSATSSFAARSRRGARAPATHAATAPPRACWHGWQAGSTIGAATSATCDACACCWP